jgi:hypothetical protein
VVQEADELQQLIRDALVRSRAAGKRSGPVGI